LLGLKSNDTKTQIKSAKELFAYILNELKQVKCEDDTSFIDSLISVIRELGKEQSSVADKQACILIIASIIYLDNINVRASKNNQSMLFQQLKNFLLYYNDTNIVQMASRAMGRLVMTGVECDNEFKTALEDLQDGQKRHAGIICLRELALAAPSRLFLNSSVFYEDIQKAIQDKQLQIRQEACELFRLSLVVCIDRESPIQRTEMQFTRHGLRRSSTASSLNSQDSLHTSINSNQSQLQQQQQQPYQNPTAQYDSLKYKLCFESSINGLEQCLKTLPNSKIPNLNEKIHGYLLIILEILKFSNLAFEQTIDKYLNAYMYMHDASDAEIKTCEEMHLKNLLKLLPQNFEPVSDPFMFLFKTEKINVKCESKNCKDLIRDKYDLIYGCISRLFQNQYSYIQQIILEIIPRLADFDKDMFTRKYLNNCIIHLNFLLEKKLYKSDVLYCVGFLSLALNNNFQPFSSRFIDSIKNLFNSKDMQRKRVNLSTTAQSMSYLTQFGSSVKILSGSTSLTSIATTSSQTSSISLAGLLSDTQLTQHDLNAVLACVSMFATSMPNEMCHSIMQLLEPLMLSSG
jgi:FKBP12-rapamycin complex-associated protein